MDECKQRAKKEFEYYLKNESLESAIRNGLTSMMSDIRKTMTPSESMVTLCMMNMSIIRNKAEFDKFIDGFN